MWKQLVYGVYIREFLKINLYTFIIYKIIKKKRHIKERLPRHHNLYIVSDINYNSSLMIK